ncbi:MAG: helix-turn-helix domain-containing protein [Nocardioidaceae bacterium]
MTNPVEIGRNGVVAGVVGVSAAAMAIAFLSRAVGGGGALDWAFLVVLALVARFYLGHLVDARSPLLAADERGVRVRTGTRWRAVPWAELDEVQVRPRRHLWSDGALVVVPHEGEPLVVPLGLTIRCRPPVPGLAARLDTLARGSVLVPPAATAPVLLRPTRRALRAEVTTVGALALDRQPAEQPLPEAAELHRPADLDPLPGLEPVIGPELAAARRRLGLSVDEMAERTRIRPHIIEAIEVDDFTSCGGDFYARGHLRTLARVLGTDAVPLISTYDTSYATAPIDARQVFEAELANGMSAGLRGTMGGPRWGVLAGVVLTLLLVWGLVRLFATQPPELVRPAPIVLDGSAGVSHPYPQLRPAAVSPVPVVLAVSRATDVVVRDDTGHRVFAGQLAAGAGKHLRVRPPVTVRASDAGAVAVTVAGAPKGVVGQDGVSARRTFHRPSHPRG